MDQKTRRRLGKLVRDERRRLALALLSGEGDPKEHIQRIEAAESLLDERSWWRPDALIAIVVAVLTALLVGWLLLAKIHDTPVHFAGRAEAVVVHFPKGVSWSAAPHERLLLGSLSGSHRLWLPHGVRAEDPGCELSLENPHGSDIRLIELAAEGESWLTFWPTGDGGLEVEARGAPFRYRFSGEGDKAPAEWRSAAGTTAVDLAGEFVRAASGCGESTVRLYGGALAFEDLAAGEVAFLRRGAEGLQVGRYVSSLLEGEVTFFDVSAEARKLRSGELVRLERASGPMIVRPERESLQLTFDGRIDQIVLGRERHSANPSRLAYLKQNEQILLLGWGLIAVWSFLWSARELLLR
jgi:hypothetical protein